MATRNGRLRLKLNPAPWIAIDSSVRIDLLGDDARALLQCTALITRDAGFVRHYFKGLKVILPKG